MKKSALALLVAFSFVSCSREDNNSSTTTPSSSTLVGVWKIEKTVILSGKDNTIIKEKLPKVGCEDKSNIGFTKEGGYSSTSFSLKNGACIQEGVEQGTYTYDATTKKLRIKVNNEVEIDESELTFISADKIQILEIDNSAHNNGTSDKEITYYQRQK